MFDPTNVVESVRVLTEEMIYVSYTKAENYIEIMRHSNPVIAAFTTANCRIKLYQELDRLGDRVFYFDTGNSPIIIYTKLHPLMCIFVLQTQ